MTTAEMLRYGFRRHIWTRNVSGEPTLTWTARAMIVHMFQGFTLGIYFIEVCFSHQFTSCIV